MSEEKKESNKPSKEEIFAKVKAAAEAGDIEAQNTLGVLYSEGRGVEKNTEQAIRWIRKAAEAIRWRS